MSKFRKRPVIVEAVQWCGATATVPGVTSTWVEDGQTMRGGSYLHYVVTAHGQRAYLEPGDWVITEPENRGFYPCKDDIFRATYEPVIEGSGAT